MTQSAWRVANPTPIPERPDLDGILEPGVEALPVRITIVQDGVLTGWDDGALGFEANAIWFSGRAASFCLSPADLLPIPGNGFGLLESPFERPLPTIHLRHPSRRIKIRLSALCADGSEFLEGEARIAREIARVRGTTGDFESEYPPLAPRPGMVSPHGARLTPTQRVVLTGSLLLIALLANDPFAFVVLCALAFLAGTWGLGDADQPALRRIAREEGPGIEGRGSPRREG